MMFNRESGAFGENGASGGGNGGQLANPSPHPSLANLHPADYTFFPNALAAAFLCPTPSPGFAFNHQRSASGKMDPQHPSPLFFQATGQRNSNCNSLNTLNSICSTKCVEY
jgi:hypothetical protein